MSIKIRETDVNDAESISAVHIASWQRAYRGIIEQSYLESMDLHEKMRKWQVNLDRQERGIRQTYVAIDDTEIVGFGSIGPARDKGREGYGELYALYLKPESFGCGVGTRLFDFLYKKTKGFGHTKLYVWVLKDNIRARGFYERMGGSAAPEFLKDVVIGNSTYQEIQYCWNDMNE